MRSLLAAVCVLGCSVSAVAASKAPVTVPMKDSTGADVGTVSFVQKGKTTDVRVMVKGLPAGQHAIHVHAGSSCTAPDFADAKGHLNPDNKHHGFQNPEGHHAGDFPSSITVGADGTGKAKMTSTDLSLDSASPDAIFGKTVVIHELVDDEKTDPAGASGKRIACGVIPGAM